MVNRALPIGFDFGTAVCRAVLGTGTELVIPSNDVRVIRYFLSNLVRKNSPAVRIALLLW